MDKQASQNQCPTCGKSFASDRELQQHKKNCSGAQQRSGAK